MASSPSRDLPRVYDDFHDGDTRLDPGALMGGSLGRGAGVRFSGGTVLMPAAVSRMPVNIAIAPQPAVRVVTSSPGAERAQRRKHSSALFWEFSALEIAVGAVGIVTFGIVVAILAVQFT